METDISLMQLCSFTKDVYTVFFLFSLAIVRLFYFDHAICLFFWVLFPSRAVLHSIMLRFLLWSSLRHLPLCAFAIVLQFYIFCMHIQTHTTYITVAFGTRISVSACTIWLSHNSAHFHVVWLLGGIFALFQLSLNKEAFNCVFNEPEQKTATILKSFTRKVQLPNPLYCNVWKQSEEGEHELRHFLN